MRLTILAGLALAALSSGAAIAAPGVDGIWFSGYAKGRGQITLQADFVDNLGKLELEMNYWDSFPNEYGVDCVYYTELSPEGLGTLHLNAGASDDFCERSGQVQVSRTSPGTVTASITGLAGVPVFEMDEVIRPINDDEYATLPANFDILGLKLGQTRTEIEQNLLAERGYTHIFDMDRTAQTAEWTAEIVTYRRGEAQEANDVIKIFYSAVPTGQDPKASYAVMVERTSKLGKDSNLHMDTLRTSLADKYGAPTRDDNRRYGRDGNLVRSHNETSQFCEQGTRQEINFNNWYYKAHCGSELDVTVRSDRNSGMVTEYVVKMSSVDWMNNDFWVKLGTERAAEFSQFLDRLSQAATSGPEL